MATGFDPSWTKTYPGGWKNNPPDATTPITAAAMQHLEDAVYDLKRDDSHLDRAAPVYAGILSPASIAANQNDYNPTSLNVSSTLRLTSSAAFNITGMQTGVAGRRVTLFNVGSFVLTLVSESASSSAANRFGFAIDYKLSPGQGIELQYDGTSSRWRVVNSRAVMSTALPLMDGTAAAGAVGEPADAGHVHPVDTSRAPIANPNFTGSVNLAGAPLITSLSSVFDSASFYDFDPSAAGAGGGIWMCTIEYTNAVLAAAIYAVGHSTTDGITKKISAMSGPVNLQQVAGYFAGTTFNIQANDSSSAKIRALGNAGAGINITARFRRVNAII